MAMAGLQDCSCRAAVSSVAQPISISSAFQCLSAFGSPLVPSVRSVSMTLHIGSYQCATTRTHAEISYATMHMSSMPSENALQMQRCIWVSAYQQHVCSYKQHTHIGIAPVTVRLPNMQRGSVLHMQRHGSVSAHQQDVGSSRQRHERDWQHLERCLEAPAAIKTGTKQWEMGRIYRVAYQGCAGAYSHAVIDEVYGYGAEAIPCGEFAAAFSAVELCLADCALIPIQNSLDGSIHRNYDLLLRNRLHIVAEHPWKVRHCLLARPGTRSTQLRRILGHPQALSHCSQTLAALGFSAQSLYAIEDTTLAVQEITDSTAIVASSKAAHAFGLHIISDGIQDDACNVTRFLQLAREPVTPPPPHRDSKTTVAFMPKNGPSDLYQAMSAFASRGIKVTNLESRPALLQQVRAQDIAKGALAAGQFKYVFVVDIQASSACIEARTAMKFVQGISTFFRVLGSYPVL